MRPLLIGQAPGPNTNPRTPLWPEPRSSAGGRLATFMGLEKREYLSMFDRVNLLKEFPGKVKNEDKFPVTLARVAADAMRPLLSGRTVVFIGRNVSNAFGYRDIPFHEWGWDPEDGMEFAIVPHTSGRSRFYNDPAGRAEAEEFWQLFLARLNNSVALGSLQVNNVAA